MMTMRMRMTNLYNSIFFSFFRSQYAIRSKEKSDPTRGIKGGVNTAKIFERTRKQYEGEIRGTVHVGLCSSVVTTGQSEEVGGGNDHENVNPEIKVQKRIDRKNRRSRRKG